MRLSKFTQHSSKKKGFMLQVSKSEALEIVESLVKQIRTSDCNTARVEFYTEIEESFSIAVSIEE